MSLKRKLSSDLEYLQPSTTNHSDYSNQSPLELLAQTCSSIGKDCSRPSRRKSSSSNLSNSNKRSTSPLKQPILSSSFIESNPFSSISSAPPFDPHCFQCETLRYLFLSSMNERYSSLNQFIDHHQSNKQSYPITRFHPYFKSTNQFPFFYPHLPFPSMSKTNTSFK